MGPVIPVTRSVGRKRALELLRYGNLIKAQEAFARLCTTEDAKEGVSAFLEKRNPIWK